ncbi:5'-3' exonuclease [Mycoplasmopsis gallopavonis]|uniref:5'-3' exonuclease n=1 Tax=Mycoplasmopsis gallopavonis TaxID=76629 RepID=A0A449AZ51_9BACT|nr:5'-3' exonuclease [Mycoplasmopsis gallopavonis]RIV16962.1 5'-3' exonuclease [Mycoplasmopsis gallopavonis]VEU72790.1 Putative DNA polymerase I [Mycoplasmopsis gallopavonis]
MNNKQEETLSLVIDGNYLMFQSFFATQKNYGGELLRSSKGVPTNAITTFISQLVKLVSFFKPSKLFIAFDAKEKTSRHLQYSEYKSGRSKAPEELFIQFDLIKQILGKLEIQFLQISGYEADDLIAAYCSKIPGLKLIFSRDKDLLQLVNNDVAVIEKNSVGYQLIDNHNFFEKFGFYPYQVVSFKGLKGDSSDNLPGVKGIGDIIAKKLLAKFDNFEGIYQNIESKEITEAIRKKLIAGKEEGYMSYNLAQLISDVPGFDANPLLYTLTINFPQAEELLDELELNTNKRLLKSLWQQL